MARAAVLVLAGVLAAVAYRRAKIWVYAWSTGWLEERRVRAILGPEASPAELRDYRKRYRSGRGHPVNAVLDWLLIIGTVLGIGLGGGATPNMPDDRRDTAVVTHLDLPARGDSSRAEGRAPGGPGPHRISPGASPTPE